MRSVDQTTVKKEKMIVVSYYTSDYTEAAGKLRKCLYNLDIPHEFTLIEDRGGRKPNCDYKSEFVMKKLEQHNKSMLWLDADSLVHSKMELFTKIKSGYAFYEFPAPKSRVLVCDSATVYLSGDEDSRRLTKLWYWCQRNHPALWDDESLRMALKNCNKAGFTPLPIEYNFHSKYFKVERPEDVVIEHF